MPTHVGWSGGCQECYTGCAHCSPLHLCCPENENSQLLKSCSSHWFLKSRWVFVIVYLGLGGTGGATRSLDMVLHPTPYFKITLFCAPVLVWKSSPLKHGLARVLFDGGRLQPLQIQAAGQVFYNNLYLADHLHFVTCKLSLRLQKWRDTVPKREKISVL